jgi:hypothetical protein
MVASVAEHGEEGPCSLKRGISWLAEYIQSSTAQGRINNTVFILYFPAVMIAWLNQTRHMAGHADRNYI